MSKIYQAIVVMGENGKYTDIELNGSDAHFFNELHMVNPSDYDGEYGIIFDYYSLEDDYAAEFDYADYGFYNDNPNYHVYTFYNYSDFEIAYDDLEKALNNNL